MEDVKEKSIHHMTVKICEELKKSPYHTRLFEDIQKLVITPSVKSEDFKNSLLKAMQENGLEAELKNTIYRFVKSKKRESNTHDAFFSILRSFYSELSRGEQILTATNSLVMTHSFAQFEEERIHLGEKVLLKNYAPIAQEFLKKGCPRCLRARVWSLLLGSEVKEYEYAYFQSLKEHVLQYDLMIDKLIIKDITLTASNDDQYFVFEDVLYQVMLCFSRDSEILKNLPTQPAFMQVVIKGKTGTPESTNTTIVFPPSGVIPFHGFSMYAAPFCYIYDDPVHLYFSFRAFYLRYWHRLHRVCGNSQGVVALCLLFEKLLQCFDPLLWNHFRKYHVPPLRLVIKWIMRAFSGHLPPEQLLTLWDLVLAYDSLEIISLLAVVILIFRRDNLLKVTTLQNIEAVLADLSSIAVIPLLQMALMKDL
uniref:TBC1 domain family member 19 n=1 Tax=Diabrotica virgifera virgifera TaxID=50390 RepID=A0A6P7GA52_DIAVI